MNDASNFIIYLKQFQSFTFTSNLLFDIENSPLRYMDFINQYNKRIMWKVLCHPIFSI